ncbi:SDR family NAD(P)-dependent oxidoreductase [Streptomyces sp. Inha503]|uniref:SDR family NAD(P)-dependent oxidoreductase n=1 Tax=Streptomyces sp. Inha503 TaxID=3383314 RepID=UPI0039A1E772
MTDLTGKTALITGSARGIGKAIALRYAQLGANIVLNYASSTANGEQALKEVHEHAGQAIAVQADISKATEVDRLFTEAKERFGSLDIVVANAGLELLGVPIAELSDEQIDSMFNVNAKGAILTMQRAAQHLADHGRILYIASTAIAHPVPGAASAGTEQAHGLWRSRRSGAGRGPCCGAGRSVRRFRHWTDAEAASQRAEQVLDAAARPAAR